MTIPWDSAFYERSPMFDPLRAAAATLDCNGWPTCDDLNRVARAKTLVSGGGKPLSFIPQQRSPQTFDARYEARACLTGEVQVRSGDWHDVLNALVWMAFPAAKAALNARHYWAATEDRAAGRSDRGPVRDALTLFDEGGVIVASADPALDALLAGFQWKELFWRRRNDASRLMRFYVFGHALYEKALRPFVGVTGRGAILSVADGFFAEPLPRQLAMLDSRLATRIAAKDHFLSTRELVIVPVLGVPGWCAENEREDYYENLDYFRPGRKHEK